MGVALARNQERNIGPEPALDGEVKAVVPAAQTAKIKLQDGRMADLPIELIRRSGYHGQIKIGSTVKCQAGPSDVGHGLEVTKLIEYHPRRG